MTQNSVRNGEVLVVSIPEIKGSETLFWLASFRNGIPARSVTKTVVIVNAIFL
jgi:hypothetical protein